MGMSAPLVLTRFFFCLFVFGLDTIQFSFICTAQYHSYSFLNGHTVRTLLQTPESDTYRNTLLNSSNDTTAPPPIGIITSDHPLSFVMSHHAGQNKAARENGHNKILIVKNKVTAGTRVPVFVSSADGV